MPLQRFHLTVQVHREVTATEAAALPKTWSRNRFPGYYIQVYDLDAATVGAACDHVTATLRACSPGEDPLECRTLFVRRAAP